MGWMFLYTGSKLTYKVIGGLLDFYFFAASDLSPLNAVQQFTGLVGHTAATPYWASGGLKATLSNGCLTV
ncbi:hypothetical protein SUGI_0538890 [Cryptomeria japonica]|nr:hypothetical protein SUGI_0538890 [Cryptomeria japonica]